MVDSVLSVGVQGIQSGIANANKAAQDIARATTTEGTENTENSNNTGDTVDLTEAIVALKVSEQQVEASATVIKTADDILGTVIDIKT